MGLQVDTGERYGDGRAKRSFFSGFMAMGLRSAAGLRNGLFGYRGVVETNRGRVGASVDQPLAHAKQLSTGDTWRYKFNCSYAADNFLESTIVVNVSCVETCKGL
jgi:hypothetical protein